MGYLVYICQKKIDIYEQWVVDFYKDVTDVYNQMKDIDDKQVFERDDEVGVVFSDLFSLIQKLDRKINNDHTQEEK
jgi:hypothetical protein